MADRRLLARGNFDASGKRLLSSLMQETSLPTTVPDRATTINVNHIRAARGTVRIANRALMPIATAQYSSRVNVDNWLEERHGSNFADDARRTPSQQSLSGAMLSAAVKSYEGARLKSRLVSRASPPGQAPPVAVAGGANKGEYLYYAKSPESQTAHGTVYDGPDHRRQGCWWMGTAAPHMYETLQASAHTHHRRAEFQQRHMGLTVRERNLATIDPAVLSGRSVPPPRPTTVPAGRWRTEYGTRFLRFAGMKGANPLLDEAYAPRYEGRLMAEKIEVLESHARGGGFTFDEEIR